MEREGNAPGKNPGSSHTGRRHDDRSHGPFDSPGTTDQPSPEQQVPHPGWRLEEHRLQPG
jgi:hypothetical protein